MNDEVFWLNVRQVDCTVPSRKRTTAFVPNLLSCLVVCAAVETTVEFAFNKRTHFKCVCFRVLVCHFSIEFGLEYFCLQIRNNAFNALRFASCQAVPCCTNFKVFFCVFHCNVWSAAQQKQTRFNVAA